MEFDKRVVDKIKEWKASPLRFVHDCIDAKPSKQQEDLLNSITKEKRITIRSGHGTGKDASVSWIILWFMSTRPFAKVVCTAPTAHQLADILWTELSKWIRKSKLSEEFIVQKDKIFKKEYPKEWWCRAISVAAKATKEEQAEALAGLHAEHLLIVCDESSGIPDAVFIPLEGSLTNEDNKVILIGNMTQNKGYFYDTHFRAGINENWKKLHWDSRESNIVNKDYCSYMGNKYGENSNVFRIRVAGEPPLEDESVLIPLHWAEQCIGKEIEVAEDEPTYFGVDVARYGSDFSIILPRTGLKIHPWEQFQGINTITLGGHILKTFEETLGASGVAIDVIGVGAGVADWLEKQRVPNLYQVNVACSSSNICKFDRLRDELWWRVSQNCLLGKYSFPDVTRAGDVASMGQELANELSSVTYGFNTHGGIIVESKTSLRARGIASPNIADALCLSEYFSNVSTRVFKSKDNRGKAYPFKERARIPHGWMVA